MVSIVEMEIDNFPKGISPVVKPIKSNPASDLVSLLLPLLPLLLLLLLVLLMLHKYNVRLLPLCFHFTVTGDPRMSRSRSPLCISCDYCTMSSLILHPNRFHLGLPEVSPPSETKYCTSDMSSNYLYVIFL